jgi:hypothetical protein
MTADRLSWKRVGFSCAGDVVVDDHQEGQDFDACPDEPPADAPVEVRVFDVLSGGPLSSLVASPPPSDAFVKVTQSM